MYLNSCLWLLSVKVKVYRISSSDKKVQSLKVNSANFFLSLLPRLQAILTFRPLYYRLQFQFSINCQFTGNSVQLLQIWPSQKCLQVFWPSCLWFCWWTTALTVASWSLRTAASRRTSTAAEQWRSPVWTAHRQLLSAVRINAMWWAAIAPAEHRRQKSTAQTDRDR